MAPTPTIAALVSHYLDEHRSERTLDDIAGRLNRQGLAGSDTSLSAWARGQRTPAIKSVKALRKIVECNCLEYGDEAINYAYTTLASARPQPGSTRPVSVAAGLPAPRVPSPIGSAGPENDKHDVGEVRAAQDKSRQHNDAWMHQADVDHDQLFGADDILRQLSESLSNENGDWIISIFGDGGAGKTTLAYEMVKRHAWPAGFRRVAWVSAKFSHLRALGNVEYSRHAAIGWHDLLWDITRQLDLHIDHGPQRIEQDLADALGSIRSTDPCVVVIDNLETIEDAELAVRFFARPSVLRPHKVIITTRRSAKALATQVREFSWRGLSDEAVRDFARYLAADDSGFELSADDLQELVAMSGGIPLLVKMAVRLAMHEARPVSAVVDQVRDPNGALGERVGLYLYEQAMDALAASRGVGVDAAVGLMNVFCGRPSGVSLAVEDFFELSLIADRAAFERARMAAYGLALIRGVDGNRRFVIHPLLREYVCSGPGALR